MYVSWRKLMLFLKYSPHLPCLTEEEDCLFLCSAVARPPLLLGRAAMQSASYLLRLPVQQTVRPVLFNGNIHCVTLVPIPYSGLEIDSQIAHTILLYEQAFEPLLSNYWAAFSEGGGEAGRVSNIRATLAKYKREKLDVMTSQLSGSAARLLEILNVRRACLNCSN